MAQTVNIKCPVCGTVRAKGSGAEQLACPCCHFSLAYQTLFCSEAAFQSWKDAAALRKQTQLHTLQNRLRDRPAFALGQSNVAFFPQKGKQYCFSSFEGTVDEQANVLQYSFGEVHTVILREDTTVTALGDDEVCRAVRNAHDLRGVTFALAAPQCTYVVKQDGTVAVYGVSTTFLRETIRGWENVRTLACGYSHLAGLTKDGRVLLAGVLAKDILQKAANCRSIVSIAAAQNYTAALDHQGRVTFLGAVTDPKAEAEQWTDIVAIAAESHYLVGLTRQGTIRLAGKYNRLLDMNRQEAKEWSQVAAIACCRSGIGAIEQDGTLHLTGNIDHQEKLLQDWSSVQPEIRSVLFHM